MLMKVIINLQHTPWDNDHNYNNHQVDKGDHHRHPHADEGDYQSTAHTKGQ